MFLFPKFGSKFECCLKAIKFVLRENMWLKKQLNSGMYVLCTLYIPTYYAPQALNISYTYTLQFLIFWCKSKHVSFPWQWYLSQTYFIKMKDSNELDVEMNSLKGKLVTTGTTLTTTTTMSGHRTRRTSRIPLNTIGPSLSFY